VKPIDPAPFRALDLRAHALLADVPLHDVWAVDLPGGGDGRTLADVRAAMRGNALSSATPLVRALFSIRGALGRLFRWDETTPALRSRSFVSRLTDADRAASLVPPGTEDGFFTVLYVRPQEAVSEALNATVHAFLTFALVRREDGSGYGLYWAIHVAPVSPLTGAYMALIDPFRRFIVYPAVLWRVREAWIRHVASPATLGRADA
jgi:hypothetical protein